MNMKKITLTILTLLCFPLVAHAAVEDDDFGETLGTIKMEADFLDDDILKISVRAEDMEKPVLGVAFHLGYEEMKLRFLKYEPGDFLERGGDPFYLVTQTDAGKIVFGETLRREDSFPMGEGTIADFYFQVSEWEPMDFEFARGVVSTLEIVRQDIDKIVWRNLSLDERDDERIIADTESAAVGGNFGQFFANTINSASRNLALIVGIFGLLAVATMIVLAKKQEHKRHV